MGCFLYGICVSMFIILSLTIIHYILSYALSYIAMYVHTYVYAVKYSHLIMCACPSFTVFSIRLHQLCTACMAAHPWFIVILSWLWLLVCMWFSPSLLKVITSNEFFLHFLSLHTSCQYNWWLQKISWEGAIHISGSLK